MRFVKDSSSKSYERSVFGVLDVAGNIGGVFEILSIIGGLIVGIFSGKIFIYSMLAKLYYIDLPWKYEGEITQNVYF